ncbi:MAG TPA: DUF1893 domain-containing protein [Candidatus Alistipes faecavium]|nr:DUF1893 domain-containing protein [Candidatus Alistipes faecavium]
MDAFRNEDFSHDAARQGAIDTLHREGCSCVILCGGREYLFRQRGVRDLHDLLRGRPELLRGSFVADKVVGKAAAALMILGGVGSVYAGTLSEPARALFAASGLRVGCGRLVPHVINRAGTGWCPLESRCYALKTPEECLASIEAFLATLSEAPAAGDMPRGADNGMKQ